MGTLTMFLIGALLPSDALIRFGRNLLFQTVDDPDRAAKYAPPTDARARDVPRRRALYYRAGSTPQPGIAQLTKV
jgi:hypothetical protein